MVVSNPTKVGNNVTTTPSVNEGAVSAFNIPKFGTERTIKSFQFSDPIVQINFNETISGIGSFSTNADLGSVTISTGTQTSSGDQLQTKSPIVQTSLKGLSFQQPVTFVGGGVAGNVAFFGFFDGTDGYFIRLNGVNLEFVIVKSSSETVIDSSTWDQAVVEDGLTHLWGIQTKSPASGDFRIYRDGELVHTTIGLGTSAVPFTDKISLPFVMSNQNTTNATNVDCRFSHASIFSEDEQTVRIWDGTRDLLISTDGRMLVQQFGNELMGENFDEPLDTVQRWEQTLVNAATIDSPVNTHTIEFGVTVPATDPVCNSKTGSDATGGAPTTTSTFISPLEVP